MQVRYTYTCGHEQTTDLDGRVALNRRDIAEARRNNGTIVCDCACVPCKKDRVTSAIDSLSEAEAKDILHKFASYRHVQLAVLAMADGRVFDED